MQRTETIKLCLSNVQAQLLKKSMDTYIATVNDLVDIAVNGTSISSYTDKDCREAEEQQSPTQGNIMGVDLGIKCPAVSKCSDGSVKFYGNGRKNKQLYRQYAGKRKTLQRGKHKKA